MIDAWFWVNTFYGNGGDDDTLMMSFGPEIILSFDRSRNFYKRNQDFGEGESPESAHVRDGYLFTYPEIGDKVVI